MKIGTIELYQVELPYSGGVYLLSGGREYRSFDAAIVRIETDTGIEGWGESTPFGSTYIAAHARGTRAGIEEIAPHLLGRDPRQVDRINDAMDEALVGHHHAKTAFDIACWDIFGKSVNLPVCELLGGSTGVSMPTISSIYAGPPEEMRSRVARHRQMGYRGHSVKIGALDSEGGPALDAERIAACLADRRPGEFFLVDANGGMLPETALRMLRLLPAGLDFVLEAPCATWRETASLRKRCPVPIIMDELAELDGDISRIVAEDIADGIGLKVTVGSAIAFAGIVHLGATVPERNLRCILDCRDMVTLVTADFDAPVTAGGVLAPTAPGLGVTVRREMLGDPVARWAA
jgi:L-alanine-DL-glutamate epimerase-like enolase superfamily enzyme